MAQSAHAARRRLSAGLGVLTMAAVVAAGCSSAPVAEPVEVAIDPLSLVRLSGEACGRLAVGGGVAVGEDRIVTNAHVVAGVDEVEVSLVGGGEPRTGVVVGFDSNRDLAVVQLDAGSARLVPVDIVDTVVSGPLRLAVVSAEGEMSVRHVELRRAITATGDDIYRRSGARRRALELDGAVTVGESGSGLFSADGDLAGSLFANSSGDDPRSYAVAASEIADFLDEQGRRPTPVGPCLSQPPPDPADDGVVATEGAG